MKKKRYFLLLGSLAGFLNGLFGAGGGVVAVPLLQKAGLSPKQAHATSVALILPMSMVSAFIYRHQQAFSFADALPYLPLGIVGAILGSKLLQNLKSEMLHRIFGILLIASALRMMFG